MFRFISFSCILFLLVITSISGKYIGSSLSLSAAYISSPLGGGGGGGGGGEGVRLGLGGHYSQQKSSFLLHHNRRWYRSKPLFSLEDPKMKEENEKSQDIDLSNTNKNSPPIMYSFSSDLFRKLRTGQSV